RVRPGPKRPADRRRSLHLPRRRALDAPRGRGARMVRDRGRRSRLATGVRTLRARAGRRGLRRAGEPERVAGAHVARHAHTVVAREPGSALAHTGLGTALLDEGRRADAAAHYRRALDLFPQLPEAEMGLALILGREQQTDEAVRHARLAIARQPKRAGFRVVLAEILWEGGRREEALAAIDEGERLAPGVPYYAYLRATRLAGVDRAGEAGGARGARRRP